MRKPYVLLGPSLAAIALSSWSCSETQTAPRPTASDAAVGEDTTPEQDDAAVRQDADMADAGLTGICASTFGNGLTEGYGRIDGIVHAVQKPSDTQCVMPNADHVVVQVLMKGDVYRLVTNARSSGADPDIGFADVRRGLPAPAFAEGWHQDVTLDYATTLGVHSGDFTPTPMDAIVARLAADIKVGSKVSIYAESGAGRPESAHLIHRNRDQHDGAIVLDPAGSPKFLLFRFADQVF